MEDLLSFLGDKSVDSTDYTHIVSVEDTTINIKLSPAAQSTFWTKLKALGSTIDNIKLYEYITKGKSHPILRLSLPVIGDKVLFNDEIAKKLVFIVQYVCFRVLDINTPEEVLYCTVLSNTAKGEAYIHLTGLRVDLRTVKGVIIRALHDVGKDILSECGYHCDTVFTCPSIVPLLLDMSEWSILSYPYISEDAYNSDTIEVKDIFEHLSIPEHITIGEALLKINQLISVYSESKTLPSHKQSKTNIQAPKKVTKADYNAKVKISSSIQAVKDKVPRPLEQPLEMIPDLLTMFTANRVRDYDKWKEVGEAIHTSLSGDVIGLDI